MKIARKTNKKK